MKNLFVYSEECIGQKVLQYLEPLADGLESITVITGETEVELEVIQWAKENCIRISRSHTFIFNRVKNHRDNLREVIQNILSIKACLLFFRQFTSKVASLIKIAEKYGVDGQVIVENKTIDLSSDSHRKEVSNRQQINYDVVASVSGEYQIYNEVLIQLYYSEKISPAERERLVSLIPFFELVNNRDGNYALSKKFAGQIWLIENELIGRLGNRSRFLNPSVFLIMLEKAIPKTSIDQKLKQALLYLVRLLIKYRIDYSPSVRLLGRIRKEKDNGIPHGILYNLSAKLANDAFKNGQFDHCEVIPAFTTKDLAETINPEDFELTPEEFSKASETVYSSDTGNAETDFAVIRFTSTESNLLEEEYLSETGYQCFERAFIVPLTVVKEGIRQKRPFVDHSLLPLFRLKLADEFHGYLDKIIPFSKQEHPLKLLKELNDLSLELYGKTLDTAETLRGKVDLRSFSSPNRPGSKWFVTSDLICFGENPNEQIAVEAAGIFPFIAITNYDRFSHFAYIRSALLENGDANYSNAYLHLMDSKLEERGNLAVTAFTDKDWYHQVLGDYCLEGDAVIRTSERIPEYGKIDLLAKAKGIIVDQADAGNWEFVSDSGFQTPIHMIVNNQSSRETMSAVVGSATARMRQHLGETIPEIDVRDTEQIMDLAMASIDKCRGKILLNKEIVCEDAIIGIAKFSYDDSQDYTPQLKAMNGSYVQFQLE